LREAFSREHALQCGFCTPGMLISARDIVQRLPGADEDRIRRELSGNLCRCTGYLGIVRAVRNVADMESSAPSAVQRQALAAAAMPSFVVRTEEMSAAEPARAAPEAAAPREGWSHFEESFVVNRPPGEVWRLLDDIPAVAACLPGARLTEHDARSAKGNMTVKLGPVTAQFAGSAVIEREEHRMRGAIRGAGSDHASSTRTRGEIYYHIVPENGRTRVSLVVQYNVQGMLAQFSRPGLVQDLGRRLIGEFAANLDRRMGGEPPGVEPSASLNAGKLLWQFLWQRLRGLVRT
jgi:carbon-monoxide dehydrogenase small subunit